jgi:hypothetical protein
MDERLAPVLVKLVNSGYPEQARILAKSLRDEERAWLRHIALMAPRPGDPVRLPFKEDPTVLKAVLEGLAKLGFVEIKKREKLSWIASLTKAGAKATYTDPAIQIKWPEKWLVHFGLKKMAVAEGFGLSRVLDTLIKKNEGFWESEEQGKEILEEGEGLTNEDAQAWASRQAVPYVCCCLYTSSRENAGKVRNRAIVYLLDKGGVVLRGRVKVTGHHPDGQVDCDWSHVSIDYRRPEGMKAPITVGDPELARGRRVEENKPLVKKLKSIPGWESKDSLVEFLEALEYGHTLSPSQLRVIDRLAPDKFSLSEKEKWEENFDTLVGGIIQKMLPIYRELYKEHPDFYHEVDAAQRELEHRGFVAREHVLGQEIIHALERLTGMAIPSISIYADASEQLRRWHLRALEAAEPSKKCLKIESFIQRAAEKLASVDPEQLRSILER